MYSFKVDDSGKILSADEIGLTISTQNFKESLHIDFDFAVGTIGNCCECFVCQYGKTLINIFTNPGSLQNIDNEPVHIRMYRILLMYESLRVCLFRRHFFT